MNKTRLFIGMRILRKIISLGKKLVAGKSEEKKSTKNSSAFKDKKCKKAGRRDTDRNYHKKSHRTENKQKHNYGIVTKKNSAKRSIPNIENEKNLKNEIPEFAELGLSEKLLAAIRDCKYSTPTEIQKISIPIILSKKDVIGTAQTGTGKTAAFSMPIIDMMDDNSTSPQVLILSPTRELAAQICKSFETYSKYKYVKCALVQGGVSMDRQVSDIESGANVVVATPGRLLDLIKQNFLNLKSIKFLILDEVDRMFDLGFIEDVTTIIRKCPQNRQTLFFSATMPEQVLRLSSWALKSPERLDVGSMHSPSDTIDHFIYPVDSIQKYDLLLAIFKEINSDSTIVFTRTRMDADKVSEWLKAHDYEVATLHSDRTQRERDSALNSFKAGKKKILVATDIASRGLDISNVAYVINYNVPEHCEDYVHRIGRTGRAKKEGKAITLYSSEETSFLQRIEQFINRKIERRKLDEFSYRSEPMLNMETEKIKRRRNR